MEATFTVYLGQETLIYAYTRNRIPRPTLIPGTPYTTPYAYTRNTNLTPPLTLIPEPAYTRNFTVPRRYWLKNLATPSYKSSSASTAARAHLIASRIS